MVLSEPGRAWPCSLSRRHCTVERGGSDCKCGEPRNSIGDDLHASRSFKCQGKPGWTVEALQNSRHVLFDRQCKQLILVLECTGVTPRMHLVRGEAVRSLPVLPGVLGACRRNVHWRRHGSRQVAGAVETNRSVHQRQNGGPPKRLHHAQQQPGLQEQCGPDRGPERAGAWRAQLLSRTHAWRCAVPGQRSQTHAFAALSPCL